MMKLGHVHIKVRNLKHSISFYRVLFDLEVTEQVENRFAFLTGSQMHHTLALQALGEDTRDADPESVGLFHIAFEVQDKQGFAQKYQQLKEMDIRPYLIDHRISWAMYFNDPDGNGLEIYVDTRKDENSGGRWLGRDRLLSEQQIVEYLD